jgi:DNA repair protein RadC
MATTRIKEKIRSSMHIPVFRLSLVKDHAIKYKNSSPVYTPEDVYKVLQQYLQDTDREHFVVVFLDAHCAVIGINTVSVGTLTESLVHPREVFKGAILANAASIICAHNHLTGIAQASEADISVTQKLKEAGRILGIPVEDHVIVGEDRPFSFRQHGLL